MDTINTPEAEAQRIITNWAAMKYHPHHKVPREVAKILISAPGIFSWGEMYDVQAKNIGLGMYEVWLELTQ